MNPEAKGTSDATPRFAAAVALAFAVACGLGQLRHEPWLDEVQAWLIATRADSFAAVIQNLAYEGHPPLWHLLLHAAGLVWPRIEAMQAVACLCATAGVFLFAWRSPFSRVQKALFAFGYFPLFEYGLIARSYALALMAGMALVAMRHAGVRRHVVLAVPLAVLALTTAYGMIVAWALAVGLAVERWDPPEGEADRAAGLADCAAGLGLLGVATAAGLAVMAPPADASFRVVLHGGVDVLRAVWAVHAPFRAFLPLPDPGASALWNSSPFAGKPLLGEFAYVMGMVTLVIASLALVGSPAALAAFLVGAAVLLVFTYVAYAGSLRHHGHLYLMWVVCVATQRGTGPRFAGWSREARATLSALLPAGAAPAVAIALAAGLVTAGSAPLAPWSAPLLLCVGGLAAMTVAGRWLPGLARAAGRLPAAFGPGRPALTALLAIHAAVGLTLWRADLGRPFSASHALAAAVEAVPGAPPIWVVDVTQTNHIGPLLAAMPGRDVRYAGEAADRDGSFLIWNHARPPFRGPVSDADRLVATERVLQRLARGWQEGERAILATEVRVPVFPEVLRARELATAPPVIASDEPTGFSLYLLGGR